MATPSPPPSFPRASYAGRGQGRALPPKRFSGLLITQARKSDIPHIHRFIRLLAEYEHLSHEMKATQAQLRRYLFGKDRAAEALVARFDGEPVGFALFFTTYSTFTGVPGIWLEDLFVLPSHRRQGVGRALLRAVAKIAAERTYGRLEWSVLDWNEPALNLYRKLGAEPMSDWTTQRVTGAALKKLAK